MVDLTDLVSADALVGDDEQDTFLLHRMHEEAKAFLLRHTWCNAIERSFFGCGVGGIIAVFLTEITPDSLEVDRWLWVVVGDVPSAYLVTDDAPSARDALPLYIREMREWVRAVQEGKSTHDIIPVRAAPTLENAKALTLRLNTIEQLNLCG